MPKTISDFRGEVLSFRDALKADVVKHVAKAAAEDENKAVRAELGDQSMSHWSRKNPIQIIAEVSKVSVTPISALVRPVGKAAGPWRVLNDGRKSYAAGDRRLTGKTSKKTGKALSRKVKRTTGAHGGKGVWASGVEDMRRETPARVHAEVLAIRKRTMGR